MSNITLNVTAKCSDLTLLYIDYPYFFLQHHAVDFIPAFGGKMDWLGHLLPDIWIKSHSNVNLCPVFYLKAYLCYTKSLGRSCMDFMWPYCSCVTNDCTCQYVLRYYIFLDKEGFIYGCDTHFWALFRMLQHINFWGWSSLGVHPTGRWLGQSFYSS